MTVASPPMRRVFPALPRLPAVLLCGALGAAPALADNNRKQPPEPAPMPTEIHKEDYRGWTNTFRVSNGIIEARVVTDVGPRILDFRRRGGRNVLQPREGIGGSGESTYVFRGGWRLWVAPERTETTYALDNSPCAVEVVGSDTLRVVGPPQPQAGIRKRVDVTLAPGEERLHLVSRIENVGDRPLTYAAWSLPVLAPGGRAFVPLDVGPATAFDSVRRLILWSYASFADRRYRIGDRLVEIDQRTVGRGHKLASGRGSDESKIGVDSAQGWAAYLLERTLFLKRFPHDTQGNYPDGGATIEAYSNHEFLELENLGPLRTIAPGEEIVLPEDWWLFDGVTIGKGEAAALKSLGPFLERTNLDSTERGPLWGAP